MRIATFVMALICLVFAPLATEAQPAVGQAAVGLVGNLFSAVAPDERPQTWPVRAVRPGHGWRENAGVVIDGNASSTLSSRPHAELPLLLTFDLGQVRPIDQVRVSGWEEGRHNYLNQLDVEVSLDGQEWFRWARVPRRATGGMLDRRPTRYVARNTAVSARYVRLRVRRVRGSAHFTEVEIIPADTATPPASRRLPRVPDEDNFAFRGWDYHRLGYAITPGETIALQFRNLGRQPVKATLTWRLETYTGQTVTRGESPFQADPLAIVDVSLDLPERLNGQPLRLSGPHRLRFRLGADGEERALYFDARAATLEHGPPLRVAALLDCLDPEGWVRMMTGPAAAYTEVQRALPDDDSAGVDAALVMAENWPADAPVIERLERYLGAGGRAVFYGKVAPSLAKFLPVEINRSDPWLETPQRLRPPTFWPEFDPARSPRQYGVRVQAKRDAEVLARWDDGSPALVEGVFGKGRVLYLGAAMGRVWQWNSPWQGGDELTLRMFDYLIRQPGQPSVALRPAAIAPANEHPAWTPPDAPANARGGASQGNMGRFGWRVEEGLLVENLNDDAGILFPGDREPWRVAVPGRGPWRGVVKRRPPDADRSARSPNWVAKRIAWTDEQGTGLTCTPSVAAPCLLWEGEARQINVTGSATHVAFAARDGVRALKPGQAVNGNELTAPWLVLFRAEPQLRDTPRVIVLSRRPERLRLTRHLELSFDERGFGALWTGRLFGARRFAPGETAGWVEEFPAVVRQQATALTKQCLAYPVACDEVFWRDGESIVITNRFTYRTFTDDWGTAARRLAPLPPVLSLARLGGFPVQVTGDVQATGVATKFGPLEAVPGDTVRYRLPLPLRDHYGVIPVEGKMDLAAELDQSAIDIAQTVRRAAGGVNTGDPFLADLEDYIRSGIGPHFEAACIDLYQWWSCFPTVLGRPAYGQQARQVIDAHHRKHYWRTLNFYPHKTIIRYRREPWWGLDYTLSVIWPVRFDDGVRYFQDQNESAAVILYCLESYCRYYGDWATAASNWNRVRAMHRYLERIHDWALMASSNHEYYSAVGGDMLNAEYPGNVAFARMARQVGDARAEAWGLYLAAKAVVPTVARWYMPDYVASVTAPGDPLREKRTYFGFMETGPRRRGGGGGGGGGVSGALRFRVEQGVFFLDTAKGTSPEMPLMYKHLIRDRMKTYQRAVEDLEREHGVTAGWPHLLQRAFLGWPRDQLLDKARRFNATHNNWGYQPKAPHSMAVLCVVDTPLFLADWAPAEYVAGRFTPTDHTVRLTFRCTDTKPYPVRLYTQWPPREVQRNDRPFTNWRYDPKHGWLTLDLTGPGETRLSIRLGEKPQAPLHPYFGP